ncbi:probable BOI-related E3 ubiquitin-protein ligase 3 [Tanacetum coccineum]
MHDVNHDEGFIEVKGRKNKGKKTDAQPKSRPIGGVRLNKPKPNFYRPIVKPVATNPTKVSSSKPNENKEASPLRAKSGVTPTPMSNSFDVLNNLAEEEDEVQAKGKMSRVIRINSLLLRRLMWLRLVTMFRQLGTSSLVSLHQLEEDDLDFSYEYEAQCFERASGLSINLSKSKLMGLAVSIEKVEEVTRHIGCGILNTPFSFLGSKVGGCMSRIKSWDEVIDKMVNHFQNGRENFVYWRMPRSGIESEQWDHLLDNLEGVMLSNVAMSTTYEDHHFQPGYVVTKPMYGSGMKTSFIPEPAFKAESGVTYNNLPPVVSRKRSRDTSVLLNEEVASQMYQQQLEIDHFVAQHAEKMRSEIAEMRRRNAKILIVAANEGIMKKLKTKEEEITRLNQVNWSLEEKLKSLLVENQIWRELAQTNEATAYNLQQLLAQAQLQQQEQEQTLVNDVESCCGSNYEEDVSTKKCLECGKKESCVLVLPCRHLCLCNVCESTITICPKEKAKVAGMGRVEVDDFVSELADLEAGSSTRSASPKTLPFRTRYYGLVRLKVYIFDEFSEYCEKEWDMVEEALTTTCSRKKGSRHTLVVRSSNGLRLPTTTPLT